MRDELTDHDVTTLLRFVDDAHERTGPESRLRAMLDDVTALVRCDDMSFLTYDTARQRVWQNDPDEPPEPDDDVFWAHYRDDLACSYPDRSGDLHSVTKATDFYSPGQLRRQPMHTDYLGPAGLLYDIMLCLPAGDGRVQRLVLFRGPGPDFTERERALLRLVRPHLLDAFRASRASTADAVRLTTRQAQLLHLVADGHTNRQIARRLGVSEATVRKHLENAFQRLGVTSRTAAVTRLLMDRIAG